MAGLGTSYRRRRRRHLRTGARSGFSMVELAVAGIVLTVGLCGLSGAIVSATTLTRVNHETALAQQAARQALERLEGEPFADVFTRYNADPDDDPGGAGTAPGASFVVGGLAAAAGDADGRAGEYLFPATTVGGVVQLREDVVDARLGMPHDLDGSGVIDAADHAANYRLLPVRVRVSWQGVSGVRTLDVESVLCNR